MSSSQFNRSPFHPIEHPNNLQAAENKQLQHGESKEHQPDYDHNIHTATYNTSQTNTAPSNWISITQLLNPSHLSLLFIHASKHILFKLSLQTQLCLTSLSIGSTLIFFSLPHKIILGFILLFLGTLGVIFIVTQKYIHFAHQLGLISLMKPGFIKRFILNGSIVDIFWEIRNSKLGIPDFLLSQILPLDEPEREMIFERLPEITRDVVSTEGLIYLTPHAIQNLILPTHLQRNNLLADVDRLSPIAGSPAQSSSSQTQSQHNDGSPNERSLRDGILQQQKQSTDKDTDTTSLNTVTVSSKVDDTKRGFESIGRNWLWQNQTVGSTVTPSSIVESQSTDSSSNNSRVYEEKKDIVDEEYQVTNVMEPKTETLSQQNENEMSWIRKVSNLFSERMLGRAGSANNAKPIIAAVIDTRMKELALQLISYVWKSPFVAITDSQLLLIFICCVGIISFYLTKNKEIRRKFIKSMKFMGIMALFWVAILCFIELNVRRKSKLFNKIFEYINKQLFHSEHHVAVRQRKQTHDLLKKSKSKRMRIYSERSRSRANLLDQLGMRRLAKKDKKSRFSRTMPFLQPTESPQSNPASLSSSSSSSASSQTISEGIHEDRRSSLLQKYTK